MPYEYCSVYGELEGQCECCEKFHVCSTLVRANARMLDTLKFNF